ncbi:NmrA-like family-domain-containing protein [Schizophyllum amplum]|uniref:NmrA-like family-domain-containing protein n=1 Tax=Schizophyllum amplum TaxID=97359 RepID=A0A550C400_9AGAR|nr:NmrA-like family-domain-containing protein [Auriculariopsis ampla]
MTTRIATVFGATGLQGNSIVRALLKDGTFTPRVVTRDVNSGSAQVLAKLGCEIVAADLGDKEAVKKAVSGAECVFAVTFPFGSESSDLVQGINIVDASKEADVHFVTFSTVPNISESSNGKYTKRRRRSKSTWRRPVSPPHASQRAVSSRI